MPLTTIHGPRLTIGERIAFRNMALVIEEQEGHARKLESFILLHGSLASSQDLATRCNIGESLTGIIDHAADAGRISLLDVPTLRDLVASTLDA